MEEISWNSKFLNTCGEQTQIPILQDSELLASATRDFGHLVSGSCSAVAQPQSIDHIEALVKFANQHALALTPRGLGLSQSGQSISVNGSLSVDLSQMQTVGDVSLDTLSIQCQSGCTWRHVVEKTIGYGLLPRLVPLNLDLTVGGTLSIGGIGASSHRYGTLVNNVISLNTVTGAGRRVTCSRDQEPNLFAATLAGLGRCSLMTDVTIPLKKFKPKVRTFFLLYTDHETWLADQQLLATTKKCDYLEGYCSASIQGLRNTPQRRRPFAHWFFPLQVSFEYDSTHAPEATDVLRELNFWKIVHTEDNDTIDYLNRYAPRFAIMRKTGAWDLPHPWVECLLSSTSLTKLLPTLLEKIPLAIGDGHRVMFVSNQQEYDTFFMHPSSEQHSVLFAILPMGIAPHALNETLEALSQVHALLISADGKRYPSGWLSMMDNLDWQRHYGNKYDTWINAKKEFDPNQILRSLLFP